MSGQVGRWMLALVLAGAAAGGAGRARAFCRLTTEMPLPGANCTEEGVGLAWVRQCISYSLTRRASDVPPFEEVRDVADLSFQAWTDVTCDGLPVGLQLAQTEQLATCDEPEYNTLGPNANTVLFVRDWLARELPAEAFGLTLVWHDPDTGEIFDADMQINETLGRLTICDGDCPPGAVDLRNVMTHEAGHFLGLGHTPVRGATMSARAELGEIAKRSLEADDVAGLCSIYGDYPEPECGPKSFQPDRGFIAECSESIVRRRGCGCSVPGAGPRPWPAIGAALVLLGGIVHRRKRTRG